jgi:hypothetical protein
MTELRQNRNQLKEFTAVVQQREEFFRHNMEKSFATTGLKAKNTICRDDQNYRKYLSELIDNKSLLIYRYEASECNCSQDTSGIADLKSIFSQTPEMIVVLCAQKNIKEFLIFKKEHFPELTACYLPNRTFAWETEDLNTSYYFVLHPDMKISHIYIPDKAFPEMNKAYLKSVKRLLTE